MTGSQRDVPGAPEERCENCRFWKGPLPSIASHCRRHPPVCSDRHGSIWPQVKEDELCGEYEPNGPQLEAYRRDGYVTGLLEARDQWSISERHFYERIDEIVDGLGGEDES